MNIEWWGALPFVIMLAAIAVLPLVPRTAHLWERHTTKGLASLILGGPVVAWIIAAGHPELVEHSAWEYAQFITLLFSLYVISGGIFLQGDLRATPRNNTLLLAIGGILASFIGTTGAAMLLIRPILNSNREREYKAHTVLFAILVVANCGGLLTPLGDPPLYIGMLRGVPFTWTFSLFPEWLYINAMLLLTYYALDRRKYLQESEFATQWDAAAARPLKVDGKLNIIWFAIVIASVAFIRELIVLRILVQLGAALASYMIGSRETRYVDNEFTWDPIAEVAILFAGIFATMIPALELLRSLAPTLPLNHITFYAFTGTLSAFLDNAPTYLTFFEMAREIPVEGMPLVAGVPNLFLRAISLGAVTCGAITYIGNGPNFMVKAVAEGRGVEMPSFTGYIGWTLRYLVPILVSMVLIFIAQSTIARVAGVALGVLILALDFWTLRRHDADHAR